MISPFYPQRKDRDRLICDIGDKIGNYFRVIDLSGEGTFSNVYTCVDTRNQRIYIIKACRQNKSYVEAAADEIKLMHKLNQIDSSHYYFVKYYGYFIYKGHTCLIFEKLGLSLFSIMEFHNFKPFHIDAIRSFMYQILSGVDLLHRNYMVHTDLKLENILLKEQGIIDRDGFHLDTGISSTSLRLIDFGSSDTGKKWHRHLVTTRHYRAPEILMGLRWGYECDIWSLGCILVELAVGRIDFDSQNLIEHLFLIQHMIGTIPRKMWANCTKEELRPFVRSGYIHPDYFPRNVRESLLRRPFLTQLLSFDHQLADLALLMLNPDQYERPSPSYLLRHKFFEKYRSNY